jgi:hypothetical protein
MKNQMRVVSVVALSLVAGLAIAQPEGQRREGRDFGRMSEGARRMGMGGNGQEAPAFNRRQIERMAERMELTEDQKVAAMTLLEGYEEQVRKVIEEERAKPKPVQQVPLTEEEQQLKKASKKLN